MQRKPTNVAANNDEEGKNEGKENVCCSNGSLWSDSCCFSARECVEAESGPRVEGPGRETDFILEFQDDKSCF